MNTSRDNLTEVLQSWRVKPPADPGFRAAVWRRIGRPADISWPAYLRTHMAADGPGGAVEAPPEADELEAGLEEAYRLRLW